MGVADGTRMSRKMLRRDGHAGFMYAGRKLRCQLTYRGRTRMQRAVADYFGKPAIEIDDGCEADIDIDGA